MVRQPIPSPSQTTGQCATDATIVALYYADGIRPAMWSWFFRNAPGGKVNIPDEELDPRLLQADKQKLTTAFLMTIGTRVLRILESDESRSFRRPTSGRVSPGMHGTTPSEVCSNLGTSLARVLTNPIPAPGEALVVDPGLRSSPVDYMMGSGGRQQTKLLDWVANTFLRAQIDPSYGTFSVGRSGKLSGAASEPIAMWISVRPIESEESPYIPEGIERVGHAIAVVRIQDHWYIADNNVGQLVELVMNDYEGGPPTPEILDSLGSYDPGTVYFDVKYTRDESGDAPYSEAQYFLRNREGEALAFTAKKRMLLPSAPYLMREVYGIQERGEARPVFVEPRTILYWKRTGRATPPPTAEESIISRFRSLAPAGAGPGPIEFGGKRKTRRKKSKRRKTKHAAARRLSSPK